LHIWYVSAYDQPKGRSTRTYEFSKELVKRGHKVTIFTNSYCHFSHKDNLKTDHKWKKQTINGIDIIWLKTIPYKNSGFKRFLNMIDNAIKIYNVSKKIKIKPSLIVGPSVPLTTGWIGSILAKKYKVPFIFEIRDVWPAALVDLGLISKVNILYILFRKIEKQLYKNAKIIITTLPHVHKHVCKSGAKSSKISYIPNGVDLSLYPKNELVPKKHKKDKFIVMYVGGFGYDHDLISIVRAAKLLYDKKDKKFHFIIYGDGQGKSSVLKLVEEYQIKNIEFKKSIPKKDIFKVQLEADILIASITNSKSFRFGINLNKLCGYFASSRPIIYSGNAPNDPVKESGAGLSIKPEDPYAIIDALNKLYKIGPTKRLKMGERGRKYAESELSMDKLGSKLEILLKSVVIK